MPVLSLGRWMDGVFRTAARISFSQFVTDNPIMVLAFFSDYMSLVNSIGFVHFKIARQKSGHGAVDQYLKGKAFSCLIMPSYLAVHHNPPLFHCLCMPS